MANPVVHFEVTGKDGKKLQDFYGKTFGWNVNADNPMNYGMVDAGDTGGGIGGGISAGDGGTKQVTFYIEGTTRRRTWTRSRPRAGRRSCRLPRYPGWWSSLSSPIPRGTSSAW